MLLNDALNYIKKGFSVIPVKGPSYAKGNTDEERASDSKRPLISWAEYQHRVPSEKELGGWWSQFPKANIGIVTGNVSNLAVVDFDSVEAISFGEEHMMFVTPSAETGRGRHAYFRYNEGIRNIQGRKDLPGIDVRGEGGFIIAPPSLHVSGRAYEWVIGKNLDDIALAVFPDILLKKPEQTQTPLKALYKGVPEGTRNSSLTRLVGSWANDGLDYNECLEAAYIWNERNEVPLSEGEIQKTVQSILLREQKGKKITQSEKLLNLSNSLTLFHDENKEPYAFVNNEALNLKSEKVKEYLTHTMYKTERKIPKPETLKQVVDILKAKAIYESPQRPLHNRVAHVEGTRWYDMGNGTAVKINIEGWSIEKAPILFKRYAHQQPQVIPAQGGDIELLNRFFKASDESTLLLQVSIISNFLSDIGHPILHPAGPQGSGKSTLCKTIKKLCDPSSLELILMPRTAHELIQVLAHHHVCIFDNMSYIQPWMSDILAQVCTGGGFSKRQLYTDDDDVIYQLKKCLVLNGINILPKKPDLLERTIILPLDRINRSGRVDEAMFWEKFEQARPLILGGIFDVVVRAMAIYPQVQLSSLERMADFTKWGYSIAEAMGRRGDDFLKAYSCSINKQNEAVIQNSTFAQAILKLMADTYVWEGTVKEALDALRKIAMPSISDPTFPKMPRLMNKYLEELKVTLSEHRISFEVKPRTKDGFNIAFKKEKTGAGSS